jgi:hypothetical protein
MVLRKCGGVREEQRHHHKVVRAWSVMAICSGAPQFQKWNRTMIKKVEQEEAHEMRHITRSTVVWSLSPEEYQGGRILRRSREGRDVDEVDLGRLKPIHMARR